MENGKKKLPVLIVGAGPVGLFLALLLIKSGILCRIIEANTFPDRTSSKSIAYQPTVFPALKEAGIFDELKNAGILLKDIAFRKTKTGEVVIKIPTPPSASGILVLAQWKFMKIVEDSLKTFGLEVERGWKAVGIENSKADHVEVVAETQTGERKTFSGQYLIAADGGKSFIRKSVGIEFRGDTLPSQLIATDVRYPFDKYGFSHTQFMMDTKDYGLISQIDNEGLWRVAFSVSNHLSTEEEIEKALVEKYNAMFPGPRPLEFKVVNAAPYKSQQLCAETMRKGRLLLVGDAAHCKD
jgi:2-polyprenyl-6-methoxyphenol hydroxylase-like FAD-dependent oxidoreductase